MCAPLISDGWEKILETLQLLPSLDTRVVLRHTLVKGWNMVEKMIGDYAKLDALASPLFIEPKGYVFVGYSRNRMNLANMPSHEEVKSFGNQLASMMGNELLMEKEDSRVVLLGDNINDAKIKSF